MLLVVYIVTLVLLLMMKATEKMHGIVFPKMKSTMILDRASDDDYSGDLVPPLLEVVFLPFKLMDTLQFVFCTP